MHKKIFLLLLIYISVGNCLSFSQTDLLNTVYSKTPATTWQNAFLSGNGILGIMVFGNPLSDSIVVDDSRLYFPRTEKGFIPDMTKTLPEIKELCLAGKYGEAAKKSSENILAGKITKGSEGARHPGFKMHLAIKSKGEILDYSRICNFETGEIIVKWHDDLGDWVRKSFVSRADSIVVQQLTSPTKGKMNCEIELSGEMINKPSTWNFKNLVNDSFLNIRVNYQKEAGDQGYEGVTQILTKGGMKKISGDKLIISNADTILLLSKIARYTDNCSSMFEKKLLQSQLSGISPDYNFLLKRHTAIHKELYDRVKIDLNGTQTDRALSNEALLNKQANSPEPVMAMWERVFNSGRYHFISSSSQNSVPALVGNWGADFAPDWDGFYHTDANLNLSISGGNIGNLPECMEGYFRFVEAFLPDWQYNANRHLGCRGFLADGNGPAGAGNGIECDEGEEWQYQFFTGRLAWLIYPFWEHYLFASDKQFMKNRLFPILRKMGDFYEDFLERKDANGKFIFVPSISPENTPSNSNTQLSINSTIDIASAKFILKTLIKCCNELDIEQGNGKGVERWTKLIENIPPYLINSDGELAEWAWPGISDQYNHRHLSHLVTVWPFAEITSTDPIWGKAALTSLQMREKAATEDAAHGILHRALVAAKLHNSELTYSNLNRIISGSYFYDSFFTSHYLNHNTFNSDPTNTLPAIMMEMLVDSKPGEVMLLPALSDKIAKGSIEGLKCVGRITIQKLEWDLNHHFLNCTLISEFDQKLKLTNERGIKKVQSTDNEIFKSNMIDHSIEISLKANKEKSFRIEF